MIDPKEQFRIEAEKIVAAVVTLLAGLTPPISCVVDEDRRGLSIGGQLRLRLVIQTILRTPRAIIATLAATSGRNMRNRRFGKEGAPPTPERIVQAVREMSKLLAQQAEERDAAERAERANEAQMLSELSPAIAKRMLGTQMNVGRGNGRSVSVYRDAKSGQYQLRIRLDKLAATDVSEILEVIAAKTTRSDKTSA